RHKTLLTYCKNSSDANSQKSKSRFATTTEHSFYRILFAVIAFATFSLSFVASATAESGTNAYQNQIRPYLSKYCFQCHGPEQQKADLRLDQLDPDLVSGSDADMWQEVLDLTNVGEMPPAEVKQPSNEERQTMVDALTAELRQAMEAKRSTGGKNVLRRMTAYEYNNTLRDLLDLDLRYSADLPPEGVAKEGFKNNSGVLGTSALHLEYFERIARSALERIILVPETQPDPYFVRVDPEKAFEPVADKAPAAKNKKRNSKPVGFNLKNGPDFSPGNKAKPGLFRLEHGSQSNDGILLAGNRPSDRIGDIFAEEKKIGGAKGAGRSGWQPEFRIELYEVPYDSPVQVRIRCAAILGANHSFPRLSFELGSFRGAGVSDQKEAANEEIRSTEMQTYEFVVQGANFPFQSNKPARPSYFRIFNDYRRGTSKLSYEELPKLDIDWVEITCNYYETWPPAQRQAILFDSNNRSKEGVYVKEVLGKFMKRAYRRPVTDAEINRKVALFERLRKAEPSFEHAIVSTLTAVLCSPNFLLLSEPEATQVAENTKLERRRIGDYELASRLSYFLWSSMPDETLFALASEGKLHQPEVLLKQTRRMLADPKSQAFSRNFADQWLDLAGIRRLAVNPEFFQFDERTKDLFEEETIRFLNHVLTENLSIRNFIDSNFAVLNPTLARHYRIPDISGGFQVIPVSQDHHRGGLLTQASMLFGNSTGAETHPIKRGVWVLERMLDDPPPPPPPNVPELPEKAAKDESLLSLKERLIAHADNASCRDCHQKIDPWGVAFENYNALGQWREGSTDPLALAPHQKVNIDPSTRLRNGTSIENLNDLQNYLLNQKRSQFRQAVVRKVMSYSLGRYLEFADRPAIDSVCETLEESGDNFQVLIEQIVLSEPFSTK
ncbi:DUF1592 domain-containing protein, partial [Rubripirellula sp.]|nr:DUF1592 domain-containing protein [Rubripirellula sp.]